MLTRDSMILVGQGREELHPLVNSTILHHLFSYLDVKSLKSVRCTCTLWNEEAITFLQAKTKITITWCNEFDWGRFPTLGNFMKYVESVTRERVFFRNYILQDWHLHSMEIEMTKFWLKCGQHIRNLTLLGDYRHVFGFYEESYVRNVFYHWTPNMESLNIMGNVRFVHNLNYTPKATKRVTHYDSVGDFENSDETHSEGENSGDSADLIKPMSKFEIQNDVQPNYNFHSLYIDHKHYASECCNLPLPWKELFIAYPNIKNLCVRSHFLNGGVHNIGELLTDLVDFNEENPNKLLKLKSLDIFSRFSRLDDGTDRVITNEHFEQALKLKFNLESLDIFLNEKFKDKSLSVIENYIVKLSPSLKRLKLGSNFNSKNQKIFPPLAFKKITTFPNLTFLSVMLNVLSSNNVEFLQNTPKLKTLKIKTSPSICKRLFVNTITLEPLYTLSHLHVGSDILTEKCVQKIGKWFPNLSEFGAVLDDKLLWAVYRYLSNSVHTLNIMGKGLTDAGITGIEANVQDKSNDSEASSSSKSKLQYPPAKKRRNDEIGIAAMKKLQHVKIEIYTLPYKFEQLTDDAVYNGFILLTELKYLDIVYGMEAISEQALRDLWKQQNIVLNLKNFIQGPEWCGRFLRINPQNLPRTHSESQ